MRAWLEWAGRSLYCRSVAYMNFSGSVRAPVDALEPVMMAQAGDAFSMYLLKRTGAGHDDATCQMTVIFMPPPTLLNLFINV